MSTGQPQPSRAIGSLIRSTPETIDDLIAVVAHALPFEDCLENCYYGEDGRLNGLVLIESILRALRGIQRQSHGQMKEAA